jgi:hypothetical protein
MREEWFPVPNQETRMTPRAIEEAKSNKRTDESFDFPETSDMCDFGYVLAVPADNPAAPTQTGTQSSK